MNRIAAALVVVLGAATPLLAAVTDDNFKLRTGTDLVALCSAEANDPLRAPALQMCQGFGLGTYQTIEVLTARGKLRPIFCPSTPGPTRNEAVAGFLSWARAHADLLSNQAVEVVARYFIDTYPCPKSSAK